MKNAVVLVALLIASWLPALAQDQPRWELFGGYQYSRVDIHDAQNSLNQLTSTSGLPPLNLGNHLNANGWNFSLQENANKWFGLIVDVSGVYGKKDVNLAPILVPSAGND